jgi:hypothetical protein
MTAPEQADTIFSKDDDPFVAIKILCFFFSLLSKAKLLFGEEAVIVSLILDIYIYIEVEEERGPTRQSIGPLFFFFFCCYPDYRSLVLYVIYRSF